MTYRDFDECSLAGEACSTGACTVARPDPCPQKQLAGFVRQECRDPEHAPLFSFRSDCSALGGPLAGGDQLVEGATLSARLDEESADYSRVFDIKISTTVS
jgi:hypothetical protein